MLLPDPDAQGCLDSAFYRGPLSTQLGIPKEKFEPFFIACSLHIMLIFKSSRQGLVIGLISHGIHFKNWPCSEFVVYSEIRGRFLAMLQQKINVLKNSKNKILICSAEGIPNKRRKIWFKK